jgi:hypothetical protein
MRKLFINFSIVLFGSFIGLLAQEQDTKEAAEDIVQSNYSIPEIPAFEIAASDPSNISRPTTAKEFAMGLYNAIDARGNVQQGLGFEVKPNYLFKEPIDLTAYQTGKMAYLLENTIVSLATIATSGDSSSTDLSWGLRIVIFDRTDPMVNTEFTQAVAQAFLTCAPDLPGGGNEEAERECLSEKIKAYKEAFAEEHWNDSWMQFAYAGSTRLSGSQLTQGQLVGHKIWLAGGLKLGHYGQLGYQAQWSYTLRPESRSYFNELGLSSRLTFKLGAPTINFFIETTYQPLLNKDDFASVATVNVDNSFVWSSGFEFKVADGLWATAGLGKNAERIAGADNIQVISGLRLGFSDKARGL